MLASWAWEKPNFFEICCILMPMTDAGWWCILVAGIHWATIHLSACQQCTQKWKRENGLQRNQNSKRNEFLSWWPLQYTIILEFRVVQSFQNFWTNSERNCPYFTCWCTLMFTNLIELPEGILMLAQQMDKDVRTLHDRLSVDQGSNNVLDSN